jgi:hypothetical protein
MFIGARFIKEDRYGNKALSPIEYTFNLVEGDVVNVGDTLKLGSYASPVKITSFFTEQEAGQRYPLDKIARVDYEVLENE